jgi:hypothetical protein
VRTCVRARTRRLTCPLLPNVNIFVEALLLINLYKQYNQKKNSPVFRPRPSVEVIVVFGTAWWAAGPQGQLVTF